MNTVPLSNLVAEVAEFGTSNDRRLVRQALRPLRLTLRDVCESPWLLPAEGEDGHEAIRATCNNYLKRPPISGVNM